jgi:bifunctional non-homologous end joining protein LigD
MRPHEGGFRTLPAMRIGRHEVALTNLDKVFFPESGLTKGDLIRYYLDLAPHALTHVERRPMQMKRYPNGVEGEFFYQKRVPQPHPDWLETVHVLFGRSGRTADFPVVTNAAGLAWIINLGCIELHTWHCRVTDVERPDYLLIDLDPSEGNPWELVPEIAMVVKEVMDELGLERSGVFVDFGQNARDRTIASAYSIRPTPDARASAPLRWDEVPGVDPAAFTLATMRDRVREVGDLTAGMWRRKVSLASRFEQLGLEPPK